MSNYEYAFLYDKPFTILDGALSIQPPFHIILLCVVPMVSYVLCLTVIFPALRPRGKAAILACDRWRKRHNIFMCLYSLATFLLTLRELFTNPGESKFFTSLDIARDWTPMMCNKPTALMRWVNGVFIISKIVEWIDTAFIVWLKNDEARQVLAEIKNKKQEISSSSSTRSTTTAARPTTTNNNAEQKPSKNHELSFLHGYHHMTTLFAFLLVLNCAGAVKMGPLVNSFVHFLMYLHYARPFPRFVVPFITASQILQFFFVIFLWYAARDQCADFKQLAQEHPLEFYTPFLFTPVYLVFFVKYFVERFILGKKKKE